MRRKSADIGLARRYPPGFAGDHSAERAEQRHPVTGRCCHDQQYDDRQEEPDKRASPTIGVQAFPAFRRRTYVSGRLTQRLAPSTKGVETIKGLRASQREGSRWPSPFKPLGERTGCYQDGYEQDRPGPCERAHHYRFRERPHEVQSAHDKPRRRLASASASSTVPYMPG